MEDATNLWKEGAMDLEAYTLIDPNEIRVSITDPAPIVILFGPSGCGKTMSLVRLTRWLQENGYHVEPDIMFRHDDRYRRLCDDFENLIRSVNAAPETGAYDSILMKVCNQRRETVCQILDLPGEHCFYEVFPYQTTSFLQYIHDIINSRNRKIWMFYTEPDMNKLLYRVGKYNRIQWLALMRSDFISPSDKTIFVCSKVDKETRHLGQPNVNLIFERFFRTIKEQYPDFFTLWENRKTIIRWWRPYDFDFVVFSAGAFIDAPDGSTYYQRGSDSYPANLWKAIMKMAKK